jgi:hypothetical protein
MATTARRLILALAFSAAGIGFGAAQVSVEVVARGVSVGIPAGSGASGASASQSMIIPRVEFSRNIGFQLDQLDPATAHPQSLAARLQVALQAQVDAGVSQKEAVATQNILVQALSDPKVLAAIQSTLRTTPSGWDASWKLADLDAAVQSMESRAELNRYTGQLKNALAASINGDDSRFASLFDNAKPAAGAVASAPEVSEGAGASRKPLVSLTKPESRTSNQTTDETRVSEPLPASPAALSDGDKLFKPDVAYRLDLRRQTYDVSNSPGTNVRLGLQRGFQKQELGRFVRQPGSVVSIVYTAPNGERKTFDLKESDLLYSISSDSVLGDSTRVNIRREKTGEQILAGRRDRNSDEHINIRAGSTVAIALRTSEKVRLPSRTAVLRTAAMAVVVMVPASAFAWPHLLHVLLQVGGGLLITALGLQAASKFPGFLFWRLTAYAVMAFGVALTLGTIAVALGWMPASAMEVSNFFR